MNRYASERRKTGLRRTDPYRLAHTLTVRLAQVPDHPLSADHLSLVQNWNGRTNTRFGTCGPVSVANSAIITWLYLLGIVITVSDDAIYALYRASGNPTFDPTTGAGDNGVDMTVMLSALLRVGLDITLPDGTVQNIKPIAFGQIQSGIDDIRAMTSIAGAVNLAFILQQAQEAQTDAGLWDYTPSPEWGGHAVAGGAYTGLSSGPDEKVVSWEHVVGTTDAFVTHQIDGAFLIIWGPLWDSPSFQANVDRQALAADFTAETGKPFPVPVPPGPTPPPLPPPAPVPPDTPSVNDLHFWQRVAAWQANTHYTARTKGVASAMHDWAVQKGLLP